MPAAALLILLLTTKMAYAEPIRDNSFLIEEAYNQEAGVVQHITTFDLDTDNQDWSLLLTQEWPLFSMTHQLSYALEFASTSTSGEREIGLGDLILHYRYQCVGDGNSANAMAPRLSIIIPTGDEQDALGNGSVALQLNLPVSVTLNDWLVTHTNFGATLDTDDSENVAYHFGQSFIYLWHDQFNLLVEALWNSDATHNQLLINPAVRGAIHFNNGLQIVPGIGVPIGVGPSYGELRLFGYLSFEHAFL